MLSLALGAAPAYDPWAWIIWGREILHLHLVTTGGPTWKPLPVILTTLFAPFGSAAPDLWLVVARAAGAMAVGLSGLLAYRMTPQASRAGRVLATGLAVAGVIALSQFLMSAAQGESEGLLLAFVLLAILRHLDGAPRHALWLGFAAALIRPETWPLLVLYGLYVGRRDAGGRMLVAGALLLVAALWFLPDLWGSGSATRGVQWAQYPRAGSAAFANCPFCSELSGHAWPLLSAPFKVGVLLGLGFAAAAWRMRRGLAGTVLILVFAAIAWILEEALLTQVGFSGSERYLLAPMALLIVAGAAGWGLAFGWAASWRSGSRVPALTLVLALVALTVIAPPRGSHLGGLASAQRAQADLRRDMSHALAAAGGARLLACGPLQTNPSDAPLAAWTLGAQMLSTESSHGKVLIQAPSAQSPAAAPPVPASRPYRLVAASGVVRVFSVCPALG